ncbi:DUF4097 family beta strand repeat-containing protein [Georgenia faecalis]|uniref:DUF4097 family beta strand repeat-containing protein n=1 Tax=Georgenia faecalis TaxID=2483799 RepID=UPI000FD8B58D|nr:DUF4097 family beta strand repeat-containing protein [Georgenia faecalis]
MSPTFATPAPVSLDVDTSVGDIYVTATDTTQTVVTVHPSDPGRAADAKDAEQTVVEHSGDRITVRTAKRFTVFGRGGAVRMDITVPEGSAVRVKAAMAHVRTTGRLGETTIAVSMGDIRCEETASARFSTGTGDITVDRVAGATIVGGAGAIRITEIDGAATVKNANGSTWIGSVGGDARVRAANGDITIDAAGGGVDARSACGNVRALGVTRGTVNLHTSAGSVDVGVRRGTAAWLDVATQYGQVTTSLDPADTPETTAQTVEVRARTSFGDVTVHPA